MPKDLPPRSTVHGYLQRWDYDGPAIARAATQGMPGLSVEIMKRSVAAKSFVLLPERWVIERSFGWCGRRRRLTKDFEHLNRTALACLRRACVRLMLRRLCKTAWTFRADSCSKTEPVTVPAYNPHKMK